MTPRQTLPLSANVCHISIRSEINRFICRIVLMQVVKAVLQKGRKLGLQTGSWE